jgi:hypothetical protein
MATVPTDIINAIIASKRTIFWIDKFINPLNIPSPPPALSPPPPEPDDELPKAEDPRFLALEVISIVFYINIKY